LGYFQEASLCSLSTPQVVGFQNALSDEHRQYLPAVKDAAEKVVNNFDLKLLENE